LQAVLAGHLPIAPLDAGIALPHLRAGKLKAIAVLSRARMLKLPSTAAEQGTADAEAFAWTGILAPKSTTRDIGARGK
jgi:tripartite-type tricarboxylate transporter receptor subunit TctC